MRDLALRCIDVRDISWLKPEEFASIPLPPAALRFRVHGDVDPRSFLETGHQCSLDIRAALATVGRDISSFHDVLDFGCGCGRALVWFQAQARTTRFFGTDIDADAIAWATRNMPYATFAVNDALPPLPHSNASFDLVYAISVFTHLNESHLLVWLDELRRVVRAGGYALLTFHGESYHASLSHETREQLRASGFVFSPMPRGSMHGIFPDWYQNTLHTEQYVRSVCSRYFSVVGYVPAGLDHAQDIVILQKS